MMFTLSCSRSVSAVLRWVNIYLKHFSAFIVNMVSICWTVFTKAIGRSSVFSRMYWLLICCLREQRYDCTHGFRRLQPITEKLGWSHSTYSSHVELCSHGRLGSRKWRRISGEVSSWKACIWWPTSARWFPTLNVISPPKIAFQSAGGGEAFKTRVCGIISSWNHNILAAVPKGLCHLIMQNSLVLTVPRLLKTNK